MKFSVTLLLLFAYATAIGQQGVHDSLGKAEPLPPKIIHAEPLFIDLIRDLGARKGEREWNVGMGMTDRLNYDSYEFLVEYEWAAKDRLGFEVEIPVTIYTPNDRTADGTGSIPDLKPSNRVESLKLATQYTFLVSERTQMSMAFGGITELEFTDLDDIRTEPVIQGMLYNPFFIAAKRWDNDIHALLYTGPRITQHFGNPTPDFSYEINMNFHYMIPGTRNFVGVEVNTLMGDDVLDIVIRPQMRLVINEGLMVGIVPGIPITREKERLSAFMRLIYEPTH